MSAELDKLWAMVQDRLRGPQHSASDHLDRGLNVVKVKPSATAGDVITTVTNNAGVKTAAWSAAGAGGAPSGPAGGDLAGTYPNPTIGMGKVTSTHILDGTIVDADVAAANKDGAAATPSLRTLGTGALQAAAGDASYSKATSDATYLPIATAASTYQPLDADLTTIAGLAATTDNIVQSKAGAWASRTPAQFKTDLVLVRGDVGLGNVDNTSDANKPVSTATQTALNLKATITSPTFLVSAFAPTVAIGAGTDLATIGAVNTALGAYLTTATAASTYQPLDSDLTTIAGLTATTDNFMVGALSAWASRTPAQAKTSLALTKTDVGLANVDNTSDVNKPVSTAQATADNLRLLLAGGTMSGAIAMGGNKVTGLAAATANGDALRYEQLIGVYQPVDADLTTIAGLTATTDSFMQAKAGSWAARTIAQVKTDLDVLTTAVAAATYATIASLSSYLTTASAAATYALIGQSYTKAESDSAITAGDALAIPKSTVTTKGDVITASAASTVVRTGVGADGTVLTASTAAAGGVAWVAAGAPGAHASTHIPGGTDDISGTYASKDLQNNEIEFAVEDHVAQYHAHQSGQEIGYAQVTANRVGGGDVVSVTVVGDGLGAYMVEGYAMSCTTDAAGVIVSLALWDGAAATGTHYSTAQAHTYGAGGPQMQLCPKARVAAFTGSKTFYMSLQNAAGTPTCFAASTYPAFIRVTRA